MDGFEIAGFLVLTAAVVWCFNVRRFVSWREARRIDRHNARVLRNWDRLIARGELVRR